jgi:hypothetical protein
VSPVRPENRDRYPANWPEVSKAIKERAGWRCECEGECGKSHLSGRCANWHGIESVDTQNKVVLTTAHLDHQPENCDPANLKAMCQGCHLRYDAPHHAETRRETRARELAQANTPLPLEAGP